jgi:tetratricopeptide (TPR) repeat protein
MASFNKLLGQAFEAYDTGRNDEAEAICRKLVSLAPKDGQAVFLLGMILRKGPRKEEAAEWLKRAATLQPRSPEVFNGLGSAYNDLHDHPHAAECFARAIQINPRYADAHYNMGNTCQRMREYEKALTFYHQALQFNPMDHEAWTNLGKIHKELNQVEQAMAVYDRALQIQPGFALAHWNRAIILLLSGRLQEGFREYEWRWCLSDPIFVPRQYPQLLWGGEPIREQTLFIHAEQGFGGCHPVRKICSARTPMGRAGHFGVSSPPEKPVRGSRLCRHRHRFGRDPAAL